MSGHALAEAKNRPLTPPPPPPLCLRSDFWFPSVMHFKSSYRHIVHDILCDHVGTICKHVVTNSLYFMSGLLTINPFSVIAVFLRATPSNFYLSLIATFREEVHRETPRLGTKSRRVSELDRSAKGRVGTFHATDKQKNVKK